MKERCDVLILGAGAAGIGAARRLLHADAATAATAAAGAKKKSTLKVVVLEARNRVGGRAWTSDELQSGLELDHGGKWIHGSTSRDNPMTQLAARYKIPTSTNSSLASCCAALCRQQSRDLDITRIVRLPSDDGSNGETMSRSKFADPKATSASKMLYKQLCDEDAKGSLIAPLKNILPIDTSYKDALLEIAKKEIPGETFHKWLEMMAQKALKLKEKTDPLLIRETIALLRLRIYNEMESYEGCRLDECSLRYGLDGTILPGRNADVAGGYGKLVHTLATNVPIDVRLGHRVLSIDRTNCNDDVNVSQQVEQVVVTVECMTEDGSKSQKQFVANQGCIVALPLGVLQQPATDDGANTTPTDGGPVFIPPLPKDLLGAIGRLTMCLMNKIEILFPSQWWPEGTGSLSIASEIRNDAVSSDDFPLGDMPWAHWIVEEDEPPILVCYATGVFAERIEKITNEDIQRDAMKALRLAFNGATHITSIPDPVRTHVTKWRSDPFARGSWTFFKAGTRGMPDVRLFQNFNQECGGTEKLYFAGEHTCDGSAAGLDIGTVHGAYLSGRLAAEELMENHDVDSSSAQG